MKAQKRLKLVSIPRDINNKGVNTHSSCQMYANMDTTALLDYIRNTTEYPEIEHRFPYNETTSE